MANLQEKILSQYGIDIAQENIFKLYKIENADISKQELEDKFRDARKRWQQSVNGANEKNAARDQERLNKADKYEAILRNDKLRQDVYGYYNGESKSNSKGANPTGVEFAREYFKLLQTSKTIRQKDIDFFFEYYQAERKNKKAILEMLHSEFKIKSRKKDEPYEDGDDEKEADGKTKDESSKLIVNLFQEATIFKVQKCFGFYEKASASKDVVQKFPGLRNGIVTFLRLEEAEDVKSYAEVISSMQKEAYAVRQERGNEYIPLVDLLNTMQAILSYRDVVDNFEEFKLLIKYPVLTPYMYRFTEMKNDTFKGISKLANQEYEFRNEADFVTKYYNPIYDNFGITNSSSIRALIKKAEKKAKANKVLDKIDEKMGRKKTKKMSFILEILYGLAYWPIFLLFFVFELAKLLFHGLNKMVIPATVVFFVLLNWLLPKWFGVDNMTILFNIFVRDNWMGVLLGTFDEVPTTNLQMVILSLCVIIKMLLLYGVPTLFAYKFSQVLTILMCKKIDWKGYDRTFHSLLQFIRMSAVLMLRDKNPKHIKIHIGKAIWNLVCASLIVLLIIGVPKGIKWLGSTIGELKPAEEVVEVSETEPMSSEEISEEIVEEPEILMVITASSANIRAGVGTSHDVVATGVQGQVFVATGNQETTSSGNVWYEIYLDEEKTQTGWASQKVIKLQEEE